MTTIVYAHPYAGSFNHAVLEAVKGSLEKQGKAYQVIDLYGDGFNPALEEASLALYNRGETADPLVKKYIEILLQTDSIVMIFPIWWGRTPAIIDGFFDKAMLAGTAYTYGPTGLIPDKFNIDKTLLLSTSAAPTANFAPYFEGYFKPHTLETVGMKNAEWLNCAGVASISQEEREAFLRKVAGMV